jgi:methionyl-tRNA formyltransferase
MVYIVFLGINETGRRVYDFLVDRDDATVLALLTEADQLETVERLEPSLLISAGFRHIVPDRILSVPQRGAVNLHNSYLPYNRGANANVWSIVEDEPAGVSIHYMTSDVDAGPIIDRREVPVQPDDTGRDLYERLEDEQVEQFVDCWPSIRDGSVDPTEQDESGTHHLKRDFVDLWKLDRNTTTRVGDLLDRLRALTFPPYRNAYFEADGEQYYVEVTITAESEVSDETTDVGTRDEYRDIGDD